jgi:hypothetical protein
VQIFLQGKFFLRRFLIAALNMFKNRHRNHL